MENTTAAVDDGAGLGHRASIRKALRKYGPAVLAVFAVIACSVAVVNRATTNKAEDKADIRAAKEGYAMMSAVDATCDGFDNVDCVSSAADPVITLEEGDYICPGMYSFQYLIKENGEYKHYPSGAFVNVEDYPHCQILGTPQVGI